MDFKPSTRLQSYAINKNSFHLIDFMIDDMKNKMDSGVAFYECINWDLEKQVGDFKALFYFENEEEQRIAKNIPNATHIKYDLQGGEICLLAKVFGDAQSQIKKDIQTNVNWQGIDNLVLVSVYSNCFFSVKKDNVELHFNKNGLEIKGGDIITNQDVKTSDASLNDHKHGYIDSKIAAATPTPSQTTKTNGIAVAPDKPS